MTLMQEPKQAPKHRAAAPVAHLSRPCWDVCSSAPREFRTVPVPGMRKKQRVFTSVPHSEGDVRRCEHGHIWYCTGNQGRNYWKVDGFWKQLDPVFNPIMFRRAKKALEAAK